MGLREFVAQSHLREFRSAFMTPSAPIAPEAFGVAQIAPRYDPRILLAVRTLDDRTQPMAEIARRVGAAAAELGLPRPSYVHLRRLIVANREEGDAEKRRREEIKQIAAEVYFDLYRGKRVDAYEVADRIREAGAD